MPPHMISQYQTMTREQVQAVAGITCAMIYELIAKRGFPSPIRRGNSNALWDEKAVADWIEQNGGA